MAASEQVSRIRTGESQTSWPNYVDLRQRAIGARVFSDVAAHRMLAAGLASEPAPVRLTGELTSPNYLQVIGVSPAIGRVFTESDPRRDVVGLAHHVWRTRFARRPRDRRPPGPAAGANARSRRRHAARFRGVAPPGLLPDFWMPIDVTRSGPALSDRSVPQFEVLGRLAPGVTHEQAQAALRVAARELRREHPELPERFVEVETSAIDGFRAFTGMANVLLPIFAFLAFMTVISLFVLLIGCANIAGLLLGVPPPAAARLRFVSRSAPAEVA